MEEQAAPATDPSGSLRDFPVDPDVDGSSGEGGTAAAHDTRSIPWNPMEFLFVGDFRRTLRQDATGI